MNLTTPLVTYDPSPTGEYILCRDGTEVLRGTEQAVRSWLNRMHSYSIDHALRYEGYSIEPVLAPAGGAR